MTIKFQAKTLQGWTIDSPLQPLTFPDGAVHITGADSEQEFQYQIADVRGLSHDDLFTLAMWAEACSEREEPKVLILPYLPGARMDRGVPEGAFIYANFIDKNVHPDLLITLDPHSPQWGFWYPKVRNVRDWAHEGSRIRIKQRESFKIFPVERIIRREVQDAESDLKGMPYVGVIAPDKGAHDRAEAAARVMGVPVYQAEKTRDFATGKLSGFHMVDDLPAEGKLLIVDDICDGGGTFMGLAEATGLGRDRLDLWVTHAIFSKGLNSLMRTFETIHTTDSYYDGGSDEYYLENEDGSESLFRLKVHPLTPYLYPEISLG